MATLILTTVGGIVGGPIGAALGAVVGQSVDRTLFRPAAREGPRLRELAVQTSSYGTQIPKLFGTMRVAGTVIWSTDLIETRTTDGGGKGAPNSVQYSYSASFAVLLSARPILGVGRIWADGKLLRGAAGDFKARTGFRLHIGGGDQVADPLIAGAQGGAVPAQRGYAYAVFEDLQLADFANRIPSLTFEVEADAGALGAEAIAGVLSEGAVIGEGALVPALDGFSAHGGSARAVLETLAEATGAWFAPLAGGIAMRGGNGAARAVADEGVGLDGEPPKRGSRSIAAADQAPKVLTVGHYDAARDYQAGLQRATRPGAGTRELHLELPAVLPAATAKGVAAAMLARLDAGRTVRRIACGWEALDLGPGDRVSIVGEEGLWRVREWSLEAMAVTIELTRVAFASATGGASPGTVVGAPDAVHGGTLLVAAELPSHDGALLGEPRISVIAGGAMPGWRSAALLWSDDGGARWTPIGTTRAPGVIGTVIEPPGMARAAIEDRAAAVVVELAHAGMALAHADAGGLDRGGNLALVGDELIQFGAAVQVGERRWRLATLWRGRLGTEHAIAGHVAGERFALLAPESITGFALPLSAIGRTIDVAAIGIGEVDAPVVRTVVVSGASVLPPSPVHGRATALADGGAALRWVRRSRAGWRWIDGVDVPLGEESERYAVRVRGGAERVFAVSEASLALAADDVPAGWSAVVAQVGTAGASRGLVVAG